MEDIYNMVRLLNSFMTYILLMVIILVAAGVAFFIGRCLRKRNDAKKLAEDRRDE